MDVGRGEGQGMCSEKRREAREGFIGSWWRARAEREAREGAAGFVIDGRRHRVEDSGGFHVEGAVLVCGDDAVDLEETSRRRR